ncbi:hypothetical protein [Marinobacter sp. M-5]|uniref:hypothetical protein n=1 Tax=Marinobacter sp. M-5 TaxID=3081089 RepID=UPI00293C4E39|nr:hypothetical protein [Marinobacter sp. M-5]MDV3502417.1 hypothetical protein [Marinobacter sp. M-5]
MLSLKKLSLASAIAASVALSGCSNSSSSGSDDPVAGDVAISGTASAPGGQIAYYQEKSLLEIASGFLIPRAMAAISGLQPVEGADVELIRVDDNGEQIGEVLATARTSITGDYSLTLPQGVNLAGNLVVRITGTNNAQIRSQVVEQDVDIDPASEFILQKFVQSGASLENLEVTDVVKIKSRVAEFDLTASPDFQLADMLAELDKVVGEDLEGQIELATTEDGDVTTIAGDYRSSAIELGLYDSDNNSGGTWASEIFTANFTFASDTDGDLQITLTTEEGLDSLLSGPGLANTSLFTSGDINDEAESFPGIFKDNNTITLEVPFEEEVEGAVGFRSPPATLRLQKALNSNVFVLANTETVIRYGTTMEGDLDPNAKEGDELSKTLEVFAQTPSGDSPIDLNGAFGRVYLENDQAATSNITMTTEQNIVNFRSTALDATAGTLQDLTLTPAGVEYFTEPAGVEETDLPFELTDNGDFVTIGGDPEDGFINADLNFIALFSADDSVPGESEFSKTLMVRLPASAPTIEGNSYRVFGISTGFTGGEAIELGGPRFNTLLNMSSNTAGTEEGTVVALDRAGFTSQVERAATAFESDASVTVGEDGQTTVTITESDGTTELSGFFNEDASIGIFTNNFTPTDGTTDSLGLTILMQVNP